MKSYLFWYEIHTVVFAVCAVSSARQQLTRAVMRFKTLKALALLAVVVACSSAQDTSGAPAYQATGFCQVDHLLYTASLY